MLLSFTLFDVLILIGISQGLVTSALLLTSDQTHHSKRILGIAVLVFCLVNFKVVLHTSGLWDIPFFRYFPVAVELLLPPLVYFYILSLTKPNFTLSRNQVWHLLPGLIYAIYDLVLYLLTVSEPTMSAKRQIADMMLFDLSNEIGDYLIVVLTCTYAVLGTKAIHNYINWLKQFKNYTSLPIYRWLKSIIIWCVLLASVLLINQLLTALSLAMSEPMYRWRFFNLLVALVTYYIGFVGYKNDNLNIHSCQQNLTTISQKLSQSQLINLEAALIEKLEQESSYLNNALTIKQLANELDTTSENLSLVINQKFGMTFRDLLNKYRVEHVKQALRHNRENPKSILDIALAAGFNSQASFYRAFKKIEGVSPSTYKQNQE